MLLVLKGTLGKTKLVGVKTTTAAKATPVPVKPTIWGLPATLSLTVTVPARIPDAVGAKVTLIAQLDPADRLAGQVLVCA